MPKMMNFAEPMEIVIRRRSRYFIPMQVPAPVPIPMGVNWPADEPPTLGGYSIGKWIDQTATDAMNVLKSETRNFTGPRVFNRPACRLHEPMRPSSRRNLPRQKQ